MYFFKNTLPMVDPPVRMIRSLIPCWCHWCMGGIGSQRAALYKSMSVSAIVAQPRVVFIVRMLHNSHVQQMFNPSLLSPATWHSYPGKVTHKCIVSQMPMSLLLWGAWATVWSVMWGLRQPYQVLDKEVPYTFILYIAYLIPSPRLK